MREKQLTASANICVCPPSVASLISWGVASGLTILYCRSTRSRDLVRKSCSARWYACSASMKLLRTRVI